MSTTALAIILSVLALLVIVLLSASIKIVRQSYAVIVERFGKYHKTLETGFHMVFPFIDKLSRPISLKESVADFKPQAVITKDNVTMQIDTIVFFQVTDPKLFTYGVDRPINAIDNLTTTTLRNIVGSLELDECLTSRDTINTKMRDVIDSATDPWGIKINRVELRSIIPPRNIQEAMEKQMTAERERREVMLRAEGERNSQILVAEGAKQSAILRAEASKAATIAEAEGKAQAIKLILAAKPDTAYITLQGFEALKDLADGQATKIIVPSDIQNVAGLFTSIAETLKDPAKKPSKK